MTPEIQFKSKSKSTLLLLLAAFILPVVLAKFALETDWFERASTNRGELLQPVQSLQPLLSEQAPKWRVVYKVPQQCDAKCENAMFAIHQVWLALGKESDRAQPAVIIDSDSVNTTNALLNGYEHIKVIKADSNAALSAITELQNYIYIVDTQGNAMLRYPLFNLKQDAVIGSRDILADLRKLLKLSRIG